MFIKVFRVFYRFFIAKITPDFLTTLGREFYKK
jgi:hypothetical protein